MASQALPFAAAAVGAVGGHVFRDGRHERDFVRVAVVVVERDEPVARLHVMAPFVLHGRLKQERNGGKATIHGVSVRISRATKRRTRSSV